MSGDQLVTKTAAKLREEINKITIKEHWDKKTRYKAGHCSMMDFEMAKQALRSLPKAQQHWAAKTAARFLPYGTNMKQWNLQMEDKCPRCHKLAEGRNHLTQCQAIGAQEQWETSLQKLEDWMHTEQTDPNIKMEIITGLR